MKCNGGVVRLSGVQRLTDRRCQRCDSSAYSPQRCVRADSALRKESPSFGPDCRQSAAFASLRVRAELAQSFLHVQTCTAHLLCWQRGRGGRARQRHRAESVPRHSTVRNAPASAAPSSRRELGRTRCHPRRNHRHPDALWHGWCGPRLSCRSAGRRMCRPQGAAQYAFR